MPYELIVFAGSPSAMVYVAGELGLEVAPAANQFTYNGSCWNIRYSGELFALPEGPGLFYIASLLGHPNQRLSASEMRAAYARFRKASQPMDRLYEGKSNGDAKTASLSETVDLGDVIDKEGEAHIRRELARIEEQLGDAERDQDDVAVDRLKSQRQQLAKQVSKIYAPNGRRIKQSAKSKLDRDVVCNAVDRSLEALRKTCPAKALSKHLRSSLKRGFLCSYEPETATCWLV